MSKRIENQELLNNTILLNTLKVLSLSKSFGKQAITTTLQYSHQLIQLYPSLKTFVTTTILLSIIPVGIFSMFLTISFLMSTLTALGGLLVVQGTVFLIGMSILIPVELGIVILAGSLSLLFKRKQITIVNNNNDLSVYKSPIKESDEMTLILE